MIIEKPCSENTALLIDVEVRKLIDNAHKRTTSLLTERKDQVAKVEDRLLKQEIISRDDMIVLLGKRFMRSSMKVLVPLKKALFCPNVSSNGMRKRRWTTNLLSF